MSLGFIQFSAIVTSVSKNGSRTGPYLSWSRLLRTAAENIFTKNLKSGGHWKPESFSSQTSSSLIALQTFTCSSQKKQKKIFWSQLFSQAFLHWQYLFSFLISFNGLFAGARPAAEATAPEDSARHPAGKTPQYRVWHCGCQNRQANGGGLFIWRCEAGADNCSVQSGCGQKHPERVCLGGPQTEPLEWCCSSEWTLQKGLL